MKLKTFIAQFFQDDSGLSSATRLGFIVWTVGVFIVWTYICILEKTLVAIPQTVVEITLVFMGGKVSGAWVEYNTPSQNTNENLKLAEKTPESEGFQMSQH